MSTGCIIGLAGAIGSGKSKVAAYIYCMYAAERYSIALPLKQIAKVFNFTDAQIFGTQEQKQEVNAFWGVSGREFMQKLGTEIFRDTIPRVLPNMSNPWVRLAESRACAALRANKLLVIDDVRFNDEAQMIAKLRGITIRIIRPSTGLKNLSTMAINTAEMETDIKPVIVYPVDEMEIIEPINKLSLSQPAIHASERQEFNTNYTIMNTGTLDDLYDQVDKIMNTLGIFSPLPRSHRAILPENMWP